MIESITSRREFRLLRETGRYRRSGPLGLRSAIHDDSLGDRDGVRDGERTSEQVGVRVGYAIGRQVGNAVVRNRIRRRLRELFRELDVAGAVPDGRHLVIVSPAAASLNFGELRYHLHRLVLGDGVPPAGRRS